MTKFFDSLRAANHARQKEWGGVKNIDLAFRGLELAGEVGELANKVKKLIRHEKGIVGNEYTAHDSFQTDYLMDQIRDEVADVAITLDLLSIDLGIDLRAAIMHKFNETSDKHGIKVKMVEGNR